MNRLTLLPFLLTAALAGGVATPTQPEESLPIPGGLVDGMDVLELSSPVQQVQIAAWVKRYSGLTCQARFTSAPASVTAAHPDPLASVRAHLAPYLAQAAQPDSPSTAEAWMDDAQGQPVGLMLTHVKPGHKDAGLHGVMVVLPGQPTTGKMTVMTCAGTGTTKLRPTARPLHPAP